MTEMEKYKEKLKKQFGENLKEVVTSYYISNDLGPSTIAKELSVPRQVIVYYIHLYGLKSAKVEQIKQKSVYN